MNYVVQVILAFRILCGGAGRACIYLMLPHLLVLRGWSCTTQSQRPDPCVNHPLADREASKTLVAHSPDTNHVTQLRLPDATQLLGSPDLT